MTRGWVLCLLLLAGPVVAAGSPLEATELRCEDLPAPLGIDDPRPRLGWVLASSRRGDRQTGYRILVASRPDLLDRGIGDLWDSGRVRSDRSQGVPYDGTELRSGQQCHWKVRVRDHRGRAGGWSRSSRWTMGLLSPEDWRGGWIGAGPREDVPDAALLLRRNFHLSERPVRATLYATALGIGELRLNGRILGDRVLDPVDTDYDRRVAYTTHEVTGMIRPGENVLAARLGNGWYQINFQDVWNCQDASWIAPKTLRCDLVLTWADGSRRVISSDREWRWETGPVRFNSIRGGETIDVRLVRPGWDRVGYDDSSWPSVAVLPGPSGRLFSQLHPPIRIQERLAPVRETEPSPGRFVFDLGRSVSGWAELEVTGRPGQRIRLLFRENLEPDGCVLEQDWSSSYTRGRYQTGELILSGSGPDRYAPRFTYHGFRYVQVEGLEHRSQLHSLVGVVAYTDLARAGRFDCSEPRLNRIHRAFRLSLAQTVHHRIRDPAREKLGWTQDLWALAEAGLYNFELAPVLRNWLRDMQAGQEPGGHLPPVSPTPGWSRLGTPGAVYSDPWWGSALAYGAWKVHRFRGDLRLLEELSDGMNRYAEFLAGAGRVQLDEGSLGDWAEWAPPGEAEGSSYALTAGCAYAHLLEILARTARQLGRPGEAHRVTARRAEFLDGFNRRFLVEPEGRYGRGSQVEQVLPLTCGLVPAGRETAVLDRLVKVMEEGDRRPVTGFIGTPVLLGELTRRGQGELALASALQEGRPGWLGMLQGGRSTFPEYWDGGGVQNLPNLAGGCAAWLFEGLGGLRPDPDQPGFRRFRLEPLVTPELDWLELEHRSPYGWITLRWERLGRRMVLEASVPVGTEAVISIPASSPTAVREGGRRLSRATGVSRVQPKDGRLLVTVGSGSYRFELEDPFRTATRSKIDQEALSPTSYHGIGTEAQ